MHFAGRFAILFSSVFLSGCIVGEPIQIAFSIARKLSGPVEPQPGGQEVPAGRAEPSPVEASPAPLPPLGVSGFDPPTVWAGESLRISGEGFSPEPAEDVVVFQPGVPGDVQVASERVLLVGVPVEARSGEVTIRVGDRVATASLVIIPRLSGTIGP